MFVNDVGYRGYIMNMLIFSVYKVGFTVIFVFYSVFQLIFGAGVYVGAYIDQTYEVSVFESWLLLNFWKMNME